MSSQLQPVRGTHDLLFSDVRRYRHIVQKALEIAGRYGFDEIKTPIFEFTQVFSRTLGDATDIVTKEMYTFVDRGGDSISLRPEGTAPVVRALISEGLAQHLPLKLFYEGPMFRYERPQKGRYRQFYQIGVELLGTDSTDADIETLSLGYRILSDLGIVSKTSLEINSIGDRASREAYKKVLVDYYNENLALLSADSHKRLQSNPLRILDSKDPKDIAVNQGAPHLLEHLNAESKQKFERIQTALKDLNIRFEINPKLVRGLDYYSHLVFEFRTTALGAQDAVLSGGRYDDLCELMGGPKTPAVGWGAGIDRIALLMEQDPQSQRPISLIPLGESAENLCRKMAHELRSEGFYVEMSYAGNMSNRMKKAAKAQSIAAIILGDNEIASGEYTLKNLDTGAQIKVRASELVKKLKELFPQ